MSDVRGPQTHSIKMFAVKADNTKPEKPIRTLLHRAYFKYDLQPKKLRGRSEPIVTQKQGCSVRA